MDILRQRAEMTQTVCAIVGFGTGVSMSVAKAFGNEGYSLALLARNPVTLVDNATTLEQLGHTVQTVAADAGDDSSLVEAFAQVRSQMGNPAVLIYNAARLKLDSVMGLTADDLVQDFKVNVTGAISAIQQVLPAMREQKQGTILLTGGGLALYPNPSLISLGIGKAGVRSLALGLAPELAKDGIHMATVTICGTVAPGTTFDPDAIAQAYVMLHQQSQGDWQTELIFQ